MTTIDADGKGAKDRALKFAQVLGQGDDREFEALGEDAKMTSGTV